jgi:hypothetical protein
MMESNSMQLEILGQPTYVASWSVAGIPGFIQTALARWQRNHGRLPDRFVLVACPQVEINVLGGLPVPVRELTSPRLRFQHFTGCHKPYLVMLLFGEDAGARREAVQKMLSWSEGYQVECEDRTVRLRFIEAIEEREDLAS